MFSMYSKYVQNLCKTFLISNVLTWILKINQPKAMYDHSSNARKGLFPGGPDDYRYNSYVRDDKNESFHVYSVANS